MTRSHIVYFCGELKNSLDQQGGTGNDVSYIFTMNETSTRPRDTRETAGSAALPTVRACSQKWIRIQPLELVRRLENTSEEPFNCVS